MVTESYLRDPVEANIINQEGATGDKNYITTLNKALR